MVRPKMKSLERNHIANELQGEVMINDFLYGISGEGILQGFVGGDEIDGWNDSMGNI